MKRYLNCLLIPVVLISVLAGCNNLLDPEGQSPDGSGAAPRAVVVGLEAENAAVTSPMQVQNDSTASGGRYVTVQSGYNSTSSAPTTGHAVFTVTITTAGTYRLNALIIAPTVNDDSFWVKVDSGSFLNWNDLAIKTTWTWATVRDYSLSAGTHTVTFAYREDGARLDKISLEEQGGGGGGVPPAGYTLVKADEFGGPSLDPMWQPYYLRHRTTDDRAAARYSFRDGALVLRIDGNTPTYLSDADWSVSSIQTGEKTNLHKTGVRSVATFEGFKQQYGYFEVRARHQRGSGHHVAFWLIGTDPAGGTKTGEIDITEDPGSGLTSTKLGNLVPWGDSSLAPQSSGVSFDLGNDLTTNFNVYGMEWQPNSLKFYVNGVLKRSLTRAPAYPCYFLLGLYQKANWTLPFDSSIPYPKEYVIDYFRAYTKN